MKRVELLRLPESSASLLNLDLFEDALNRQYVDTGRASNRFRNEIPNPLVGEWYEKQFCGVAALFHVVSVPVELIEVSEDTGPEKWRDVELYANWVLDGHVAPPITIFQNDYGRLRTTCHRRLLAAKAAGKSEILSFVNYAVRTPDGKFGGLCRDDLGKPVAIVAVQPPRPGYTIMKDDAAFVEKLKVRLSERSTTAVVELSL